LIIVLFHESGAQPGRMVVGYVDLAESLRHCCFASRS
jgi:hypothetical protein